MRLHKFKDFLKLPAGVIFSYYQPCIFNGLFKKGSSIQDIDFFYEDLIAPIKCSGSDEYNESLMDWREGEELELEFDVGQREGLFDEEQLYAVYSEDEINRFTTQILNNTNRSEDAIN